jgi:hypothetical protein
MGNAALENGACSELLVGVDGVVVRRTAANRTMSASVTVLANVAHIPTRRSANV